MTHSLTYSLTGVKCRATSVAKKLSSLLRFSSCPSGLVLQCKESCQNPDSSLWCHVWIKVFLFSLSSWQPSVIELDRWQCFQMDAPSWMGFVHLRFLGIMHFRFLACPLCVLCNKRGANLETYFETHHWTSEVGILPDRAPIRLFTMALSPPTTPPIKFLPWVRIQAYNIQHTMQLLSKDLQL